ncbi:hypothetical protein VTI28DRAFT_6148 [Corynascus sepedonium]
MQLSRPRYRSHLTKLSTYETDMGSLLVLWQRRWGAAGPVQPVQSFPARFQGLTDLYEEEVTEEVTTSITLISRLSHARRAIKLNTRQKQGFDGVFSFIPRLSVYNVLPEDSLVFTIVGQGRLREFQALLREGKASLRDQDENGAPLLHYANRHPEICRCLIQCGADVNHVASVTYRRESDGVGFVFTASPIFVGWFGCKEEEGFESALLCQKYLLAAGSDPTIPAELDGRLVIGQCNMIFSSAIPVR